MLQKNKSLPIHYKASSTKFELPTFESRKVSGYFANFDTIDSDMDIIRKGAFAKSIAERGPSTTSNRQIKYLHQHCVTDISGPLKALTEDNFGLYFEGLIEQSPMGDVILERYMNGTYKEHSIGFKYVWDKCQWIDVPIQANGQTLDESMMVFECNELNLFEGSVVTFGANPNTPFMGFKGATQADHRKQLDDELDFLIRHAPNYQYELAVRSLYAKQYSLSNSIAESITKESKKAETEKAQSIKQIQNFKFV